ncbi:30S ribosomal protein THX [Spirosoma aerolatum]
MGKGDRKTRKGKISMGSYGKTRPQKPKQSGDIKTTTQSPSNK